MNKMRSIQLWCVLVSTLMLWFSGAVANGAAGDKSPNILFVFADDQRADTIGAWGNAAIRTPNIDRLAKTGFSFRANYCMGAMGGAVCVPSRAMVNTGLSLYHVRSDMKGAKLMPEVLRNHGYVTFGTGKWHNQQPSFLRGFEKGRAVFFGGMSDHFQVPLVDLNQDGELVNKRVGKGHSSELFTDAAVDFLRSHDGGRPFYAYVAFTAPHDPRDPPLAHRRSYYEQRPPLPENFLPQHPFDNGNMGGRDENLGPWPRTRQTISDQLCEYYGLITHMDEQIGRLLKVLKETGHGDNTIIVYAADHGLAVGSHGLLGKQNIYEHSMKCPLIFSGPGIPQGESRALTYLLDVFPTVCGLTGVELPAEVEGHDLGAIWQGRADGVRDSLFLAFRHLMRSVRDDRWKLIRYPQINHTQLFDLKNDPHELNNLADAPEQSSRVKAMTSLLAEWQTKVDDPQPLTSDNPDPMEIDLTGHERKPDRWQPKWIRDKYFGGAEPDPPRPKKTKAKKAAAR